MADPKVALITGAGKRIGAEIARYLHGQGMNVIIHYLFALQDTEKLVATLNKERENSAVMFMANLNDINECEQLIQRGQQHWQRLDVLVNNASRFYPTPFGSITLDQWQDLFGSNLQAPLFLSQTGAPFIREHHGCIVNIADIHAEMPLKNYTVYCMAKAGLMMLTKSLAKELAPEIRVNAVAPGAVLWPENHNELDVEMKNKIVKKTLLKRAGTPLDVAKAVWFFINDAPYVTGQVLPVDGGRLL